MTAAMQLSGRVALVTGAASGIGHALAVALAGRGCHLALVDIDEAGLAETAAAAASPTLRITRHHLDITDAAAIAALPFDIRAAHGGLDLLVNNAGVALGGTFEEVTEADFEWLFAINFFGVVRMTRAFLPLLRRSDDARIVNLSSLFGIIAPPGQAAYVASKFAVRGFSESLRHELAGSTVGMTTVHPGGVATKIAANARMPPDMQPALEQQQKHEFEKMLRFSPAAAADRIVRGVERRQARIVIGNDARIGVALERLFPMSNWAVIMRLASLVGPKPR